ncbi:GNAT family N-acetyltransferase [Salinisphaera sp. Q1T1-3]|nr:GNAT family N-acetyltransferase [Salinisphaera sp. Q1T1-3]
MAPADAPVVARIQRDAWRAAYAGIVPADYLAAMDLVALTRTWAARITHDMPALIGYVACDTRHRVIGYVVAGPHRDPAGDDAAEIRAIYVAPDRHGEGVGRSLMQAAAVGLRAAGFGAVRLWVFVDNTPARAFYETLGGTAGQRHTFKLGGALLEEIDYRWPKLARLCV